MCTAPPTEKLDTRALLGPHSLSGPDQKVVEEHAAHERKLANNFGNHTCAVHKQVIRLKWVASGLATLGSAVLAIAFVYNFYWLGVTGAVMIILSAGVVACFMERSGEERRYYEQWKRAELACDLLLFNSLPNGEGDACKADKLLSNNDEQLRSYYELNLAQCSKIFWVGILCLAVGVCIVVVTVYYVLRATDDHAQTVIGAVGGASAILIHFVAVVFLKMHSEILTLLKEFQSKLVDTQELYLANVLASRIEDKAKRFDAFKDLSYVMAADAHSGAALAYGGAKPTGANGTSKKDK